MVGGVTFEIADLEGLTLGWTGGDTVLIDVDAAGHGWFVDPTAYDDTEFRGQNAEGELVAGSGSPAYGDMDLLTVVMHELGHVLGFEDLDPEAHDLMSATLDPGVRRLPEDGAIASVSLDSAASSQIESQAEIDTRILGGLGFDHYSPTDSKFGRVLADTNNGNRISSGWFIEVLARQVADAKARRDGNSFIDERSVNENDADSQTVDDGLTNLVQMALSQEHDDGDGSIAAVNGSEQGSWLLRWLLNGAEDDDGSDPNADIQVVIPAAEDDN